jgi:threonine aldolase
MRFLAAQWLGLLTGDTWLRNAQHANGVARALASRLRKEAGIESLFPVEANAVFVSMDERLAGGLRARGWRFYKFIEPDVYRLMCSWSTTGEDISCLLADIVAIK